MNYLKILSPLALVHLDNLLIKLKDCMVIHLDLELGEILSYLVHWWKMIIDICLKFKSSDKKI